MNEICVIAPIYNESPLISEFVTQVSEVLDSINIDNQIILIDDGSKDNSWEIIKQETRKNSKVKAIRLSRNFGHHHAITAGIHKSNSKWTVVMDTDLQDRPVVIKELYCKAIEGFEVVFVSRKNRPEAMWYLFIQKLFYKAMNIMSGLKFNSKQANFSIINFKVVEAFRLFNEYSRFYGSTIKWLGFKTAEIEADHGLRFKGKPSYTFKKRLKLGFDIILAYSDRPLKFVVTLCLTTSFLILILGGMYLSGIYSELISRNILKLAVTISVATTATILLTIGVFGNYLISIFREVKKRPLYVISEEVN
jgi:dolichol-phosphate mannosyltransferase